MPTDTCRIASHAGSCAAFAASASHSLKATETAQSHPDTEAATNHKSVSTGQIAWEAEFARFQLQPALSAEDERHSAFATLISPGASGCVQPINDLHPSVLILAILQESDLQSRVCQLEHQLQQVQAQRSRELQELHEIVASLQQKEQEMTLVVASQAAAQQQQDELKQVLQPVIFV